MISTYNEWDTLKKVVVGIADYANWPDTDKEFKTHMQNAPWKDTPPPAGAVPESVVEEANEDLDKLSDVLRSLGVEVVRPETRNFIMTQGMYNYCPRDRLLVYGDTVVDCAMMYPSRDQEIECLNSVIKEAGRVLTMPRDRGMILDAANICRLGDHWLFLESISGNKLAYDWLKEQFPEVTIELCNFYSGVHIDSTVSPLREGLVLLNGHRVNDNNCPDTLKSWDKIYVNEVVHQDFYQYPYASNWIAVNVLAVNPNTVIVDAKQKDIIKQIENRGIDVIPLELRHSRTLGGGFHCVTLDLVRNHNK